MFALKIIVNGVEYARQIHDSYEDAMVASMRLRQRVEMELQVRPLEPVYEYKVAYMGRDIYKGKDADEAHAIADRHPYSVVVRSQVGYDEHS